MQCSWFKILMVGWMLSSGVAAAAVLASGAGESVQLAWNPSPATGLAGYKIFYGTNSHAYAASVSVGAVTNTTVAGLAAGMTYYFAAAAVDAAGNLSPLSNEASITTTNLAASLSAPVNAGGQFSFTVSGVAGSKYVVQASTNLTNWSSLATNIAPFVFVDPNAASYRQRFYRSFYLSP